MGESKMGQFKIVTDINADLPASYLEEHEIEVMYLSYTIDQNTYSRGKELDYKEFYRLMREGKMPTTSQVNPDEAKRVFLEAMKDSSEILCLSFSFLLLFFRRWLFLHLEKYCLKKLFSLQFAKQNHEVFWHF